MTASATGAGSATAFAARPLWWTLVRHELRLAWRSGPARRPGRLARVRARSSRPDEPGAPLIARIEPAPRRRWWRYAAMALLLHALGAFAVMLPRAWPRSDAFRIASVYALLLLFTLMVSYAMSRVIAAFHERRDLDLLLTAPVAPSLLLGIRAASTWAAVTLAFAAFTWPFANVGVVTGHWWLARLYPIVPLFALVATAFALMVTDLFVRLVGVRRARVGLQVFSAFVGASMYLVSQARTLLPEAWSARGARFAIALLGPADGHGVAAFVYGIASGRAGAWVVLVVAGAFAAVASVAWARNRFVDVAQNGAATVAGRASHDRVAGRVDAGFRHAGFVALVLKEWRLTWRAPQLLSQILLQLLYLAPLLFAAFGRGARVSWSAAALVAGIVGIASTLATSLAWLAVSAEDAPDLLAGSPQRRGLLLAAKLCAAVVPPLAIVTLATIGLATRAPADAAILWPYGAAAAAGAAILASAGGTPGRRSDFQRRHRGRGLAALVEALQFLLWAGAAGLAAAGLWLAAIPVTLAACAWPAWRLRRALALFDEAG